MSLEAPPAPGRETVPIAVDDGPRPRVWPLVVAGGALVGVVLAVVAVILASFGGAFSTYATAEVQLPASSTAVALGAPVEYRNVTVGTVASQGRAAPGGLVDLTVHLQRQMLQVIPSQVQATETPVSFFGDPYVELVPPPRTGGARLRQGAVIPALEVGQTGSLQATLGSLDTLLIKLRPSELDAALTALASALQGNGTSLGHNLVRANTYFEQMLPLWPTVVSNLDTLVPVANQFTASTPDLLQILANQTVTATTVNHQAAGVRQAIGGGEVLAGQAAQLLGAVEQPFAVLAADSGSFLTALSQSPNEISQLLSGLDAWATAWTTAEASGPYLQLTQTEVVANPADLGLAVLGGPEAAAYLSAGLGPGFVNPPTYASAGPLATANLTSSEASPDSTTIDSSSGVGSTAGPAPIPVVAEPAQTRAVSRIVTAVSGSTPSSSAVSTLLLSPVLESLVS